MIENIEYRDDLRYKLVYSYDASGETSLVRGVFFPKKTTEVSLILKFLNKEGFPFIIKGASSGIVGSSVPIEKDKYFVISLEKMNKILDLDLKRKEVLVETGILNGELNKYLKKYRLMYPPDPASFEFSTIGGNIATNAGGLKTRFYGTTKDYVLGERIVLRDGTIISTGFLAEDYSNSFIEYLSFSSEGNLFVVTEALLKLEDLDDDGWYFLIYNSDLDTLIDNLILLLKEDLDIIMLEYIEKDIINLLIKYLGFPYTFLHNNYVLLLKVRDKNKVLQFIKELDIEKIFIPVNTKEREILLNIRRSISPVLYYLGNYKINEDISLPIRRLKDFLMFLDENKKYFKIYTFGHAGDGNLHINLMVDYNEYLNKKEIYESFLEDFFKKVIDYYGTLSGEHGIGRRKKRYYTIEHKKLHIELESIIKRSITDEIYRLY